MDVLVLAKWSNLKRTGGSRLTHLLAITPIFAVFFSDIAPILSPDNEFTRRMYNSYLGMCLVGLSGIIYRLSCPFVVLRYETHLEYIALFPLIVRERYNQIREKLDSDDCKTLRNLAAHDERFIPRGFFEAATKEWHSGQNRPEEDVRRILLYNYLIHDHSLVTIRVLVLLIFLVGTVLIALPAFGAMFAILRSGITS